jgi:hypothetical protein
MSIPSFPPRPEDTLRSDSAGIAGATEIKNLVNISQASYDALAKKDSSTLYVVKGAGALVAGVASVNGQTGAVTVNAGVSSVNGQTGNVSLSFSSPGHTHTAGEVGLPSISVGALTSTVGASSSEYYEYGLTVNLPSAGAYDVRVVLVGASTSLASGGALVAINGSSYVGSAPPAGYALYGGAELVGNTAQAMVASTTSALSSSFVYATSAAASLAVKLNTANPPDAAHLVPGSHIIAIRCGDGPS